MRPDGRRPEQLRSIQITPDFISSALASVLVETGRTRVICTISCETKVPGWVSAGGWLTAEYAMLPGSTSPRGRRDPGGRGKEIQRLIGRSLRAGVDLARLVGPTGGLSLICDCDVIQADGGTRTASITGCGAALGIAVARLRERGELADDPLRGSVAAVSVGLVDQADGVPRPVLDLDYAEDHRANVDLNVVMLAVSEGPRLIEVQGTAENGVFGRDELNAMLDLAERGVVELVSAQQDAVKRGLASA